MTKEMMEALSKVQSEIKPIKQDAENPYFKSHYATLGAIQEVVQPILAKNGFVIVQPVQNVNLETRLVYKTGEELISLYPIISKSNTNPQDYGSAVTYARRYSLSSLLGIVTELDDDANATSPKPVNNVVTNVNKPVTLTPAQEKHVENVNKVIATTTVTIKEETKPNNSSKAGVTIEGFVTALKEKDWKGKPVTEYTVEADGKGKIKVSVWDKACVSVGDMVQFLNITSKPSEKYGEQFTAKSVVKIEAEQAAF